MQKSGPRLRQSRDRTLTAGLVAAGLVAALAGCGADGALDDVDVDGTLGAYALVTARDGLYFFPPLAPTPTFSGAFEAGLLAELEVRIERTSGGADFDVTVATFDRASSPALYLMAQYERYLVNVEAARYFTEPSQSYRIRVLHRGEELGRADMPAQIFPNLRKNPAMRVGVHFRVERAALSTPEVCDGRDNDFDGTIDDGNPGGGADCETGPDGVCAAGQLECVDGRLVCEQTSAVTAEVCNGLDDDCDGRVDEDGVCGPGAPERVTFATSTLYAACAIASDGTVSCAGDRISGLLGDGRTDGTNQLTPVVVPDVSGAVSIAGGSYHFCALLEDGRVTCWGLNTTGQCGAPGASVAQLPTIVAGLTDVVQIVAGVNRSCALTTDGSVFCWGSNVYGQLGNDSNVSTHVPQRVTNLGRAYAITTGQNHTCAIVDGGTITCWGVNTVGQLGMGTVWDASSFTQNHGKRTVTVSTAVGGVYAPLAGAVRISAAIDTTHALLADGTVWGWGQNAYAMVGISSAPAYVTRAHRVEGLDGVIGLGGGNSTACALLTDRTVRCWGTNTYGNLGDGSSTFFDTAGATVRRTPVVVVGLTNVVQLKQGYSGHQMMALTDAGLYGWGRNVDGELAIGTSANVVPTPVRTGF
ncbi:hypothetical protein L6R52_10060 [Myxococcota bacterium]|nr:hypothetical protein [Myxococcota bacterium]